MHQLPSTFIHWLTAIALLFAAQLGAQDDTRPEAKTIVVQAKPSDADVEQALEAVKATILPRCWDDKCEQQESRRKKYLKKWHAVVSDHYIVFTDGPLATCKKYGVTLETLYDRIQKDLPFKDPDHLLVAYIFKDKEDYYRYAVNITGYSEAGARTTAGHAMSHFYATYHKDPRASVVYHEAAHEIVGACLKVNGVGSWFQEGIAVYFEKKLVNEQLESCRSDIKRGDYYPLTEFIALESLLGDPKGNGHRNYAHAGALLTFMIETEEQPVVGKFGEFLEAARKQGYGFMRGAKPSERLIRDVYGLSVDEFEQVWLKHLRIKS